MFPPTKDNTTINKEHTQEIQLTSTGHQTHFYHHKNSGKMETTTSS